MEVPQILAQLSEQVMVVSSPSDLLALLGTISVLAKVVVDARIQLTRRALEVSSLSHGRGQLGSGGLKSFASGHFCPPDVTMGCQTASLSRV